jgi:hypothetical protein
MCSLCDGLDSRVSTVAAVTSKREVIFNTSPLRPYIGEKDRARIGKFRRTDTTDALWGMWLFQPFGLLSKFLGAFPRGGTIKHLFSSHRLNR